MTGHTAGGRALDAAAAPPGRLTEEDAAALDGLRGVAALMVVFSHASLLGADLVPLPLEGIGKYGVFLFFVISAFLLTLQWLVPEPGQPPARLLRRYLVRRVARIYPLYALVLIAGWALPPPGLGVPLDTPALGRHLALLEGRGIYWSIPVEFAYYLVLPGVAALLGAAGRLPVVLRLVGWAALLLAGLWLFPASASPLNSIRLGDYLPIFLFGSLAAAVFVRWPTTARAGGPWRVVDALVLAALAMTVPAVLRRFMPDAPADLLHRAFLAWGLFWSVVLLGLLRGPLTILRRLCRTRFLGLCGRWCFALYLLHMPALYAARKLPLPPALQGWLGLALALALAAAAHACVERPAIRWARRVTASR